MSFLQNKYALVIVLLIVIVGVYVYKKHFTKQNGFIDIVPNAKTKTKIDKTYYYRLIKDNVPIKQALSATDYYVPNLLQIGGLVKLPKMPDPIKQFIFNEGDSLCITNADIALGEFKIQSVQYFVSNVDYDNKEPLLVKYYTSDNQMGVIYKLNSAISFTTFQKDRLEFLNLNKFTLGRIIIKCGNVENLKPGKDLIVYVKRVAVGTTPLYYTVLCFRNLHTEYLIIDFSTDVDEIGQTVYAPITTELVL